MSEKRGARIVKCFKEVFPRCRFVGKRYGNRDRVNGDFGARWMEWHENGWFAPLEGLLTEDFRARYPDAAAYIGLEKNRFSAPDDYYEYWIGMFLSAGCQAPEGYEFVDFTYDFAGICFIQGREDEVFFKEGEAYQAITGAGMRVPAIADGGCYFFERYACPRSQQPDGRGEIILDIGYFVE